ncbi:MAG: hypothetical protein JXQ81_14135 [Desulfuromonadales bacterium]|nr:hypothetical protein [Desulfuromonadales bacterium]MBN2793647.1 hypothetical protein [Desulfuromonadales bacterium]
MGFFRQSTKINVVYKNGVKDRISPALLSTLIDSRQIDRFEREEGWAKIGVDPVRSAENTDYTGADRRIG